jgi:DNA-binding MarR family transcriptional regulator
MTDADEVTRLYLTLGHLNRALRRGAGDAAGGAAPVGHGALSVLSTLVRGGPTRLGTLAAVEGVSAPSMTRIVASLEQLGHVRRAPDPADGRATILDVTDSGRQVVVAGREGRLLELRRRVQGLPEREQRALWRLLPVLEELAAPEEVRGTVGP